MNRPAKSADDASVVLPQKGDQTQGKDTFRSRANGGYFIQNMLCMTSSTANLHLRNAFLTSSLTHTILS